jgi:RHS repeat-associated protein
VDYFTPYKFNGKELDEETGLYYYGARYMNPRLSIWYATDRKQEENSNISTYSYVVSNPTMFVDFEGYKPRIYYELQEGVGHTFVTTGSGNSTTVYTYGRYAEMGKDKSSARSSTPTGEGVLIILKGQDARNFIEDQINNKKAAVYEFVTGSDDKVDKFFQDKFNKSDKIPTTGIYQGNKNARVIDEYNLFNNNCTTLSIEAIEAGGGDTSYFSSDISPLRAAQHTSTAIIYDKIKSWFGADRKIITIDPQKVLNEFNKSPAK